MATTALHQVEERMLLYHATTRTAWEQIRAAGAMTPSTASYDWLGRGVYFWQAAPVRAWMWKRFDALPAARRSSAAETVVLQCEVSVRASECIDLLDVRWQDVLRQVGREVPSLWRSQRVPEETIQRRLSWNRRRSRPYPHYLDCGVIDQVCERVERELFIPIRLVRAAYQQSRPLYPFSAFRADDHVQVAVRDSSLIDVATLSEVVGLAELEEQRRGARTA